jgi:hypothetical protein
MVMQYVAFGRAIKHAIAASYVCTSVRLGLKHRIMFPRAGACPDVVIAVQYFPHTGTVLASHDSCHKDTLELPPANLAAGRPWNVITPYEARGR